MTKKSFILFVFTVFCTVAAVAQIYTRKTNLPHIYIETVNSWPITSKTTYISSTMYYVDEDDAVTRYDDMQIRGRGNSTWNLSKKPYKIKFQQKEKFLGKGYANAKKWTLLANAGDKSLMRNAITSLMGDFLGLKNNPAHKFVDLTLNGRYLGNYQISDQVEVRPHRVNITEQDYPLTDESDITGGYLLEVDGFKDGNCFTTSTYRVPIRIHYPEDEEISSSQNNYIRQYIRDFESALSGSNFADAEKGYRKWVDSVSLANWFLATEISGNIDGYYSTYFYKEQQDPLIYWGPLWDYDIAYNNDYRITGTETKLMTDEGYGETKNWINRMWEDPWFYNLVNRRYREVVDAGLEEYMYQQIDSIVNLVYDSQVLNYKEWGIDTRMYHEIVLYSSYSQYITYLKNYIKAHMAYLQTAFASKKPNEPTPPVEPTPPFTPKNYYYRISNVSTSKVFDIEGGVAEDGRSVYSWTSDASRTSQQWRIVPVDDYFMIINRDGNVALNDPTKGESTATTNTGTQLNVATTNIEDDRQLWTLTPQGTGGRYNITNKYTQHTANLNGGNSADGTTILSYTTDSRNSESTNRQWYIIADEKIEGYDDDEDNEGDGDDEGDGGNDDENGDNEDNGNNGNDDGGDDGNNDDDGNNGNDDGNNGNEDGKEDEPNEPDEPKEEKPNAIGSVEPAEYALGYNPQTKILHFGSETPELLTFTAKVYSASGSLVRTFVANESCSIADLPHGVYLIIWNVDGKTRSAKVIVQ